MVSNSRRLTASRIFSRVLLFSVATGLLVGMAWLVRGRQPTSTEEPHSSKPMAVRIHTIETSPTDSSRSFPGIVQARFESELAFRVGGKISKRYVDVGATVAAGDLLFELEADDYQLQVEAAQADLVSAIATARQAAADEQRMRALRTSNSISEDEYERASTQNDVAKARRDAAQRSLDLAKNRLSYTQLRAPTAGVVTAITAERGQVVNESRSVARLTQGNELEVLVGIPERFLKELPGSSATLSYWSLPGATSAAVLRELAPNADPLTRTYAAKFTIHNAPSNLQLGMSATLHLQNEKDASAIAIPAGALSNRRETLVGVTGHTTEMPIVWRVIDEQGHIESVPVEVLRYGQEDVLVRGNLSNGDRIVSAGVHKLDSGVTVRRWEELK